MRDGLGLAERDRDDVSRPDSTNCGVCNTFADEVGLIDVVVEIGVRNHDRLVHTTTEIEEPSRVVVESDQLGLRVSVYIDGTRGERDCGVLCHADRGRRNGFHDVEVIIEVGRGSVVRAPPCRLIHRDGRRYLAADCAAGKLLIEISGAALPAASHKARPPERICRGDLA